MAVAHVQSKGNALDSTTVASIAVTLPATVGVGNTLVVFAKCSGFSSLTDDKSNTYTSVQTVSPRRTFYCKNVTNAPQTITCNVSPNEGLLVLVVHEVSGVDLVNPLDTNAGRSQASPGTGTDALTTLTATTSFNGDYIFGCTTDSTATHPLPVYVEGTGFTKVEDLGSSTVIDTMSEYLIQTSAGAVAATWTVQGAFGTDTFGPMMVALKAASVVTPITGLGRRMVFVNYTQG